MFVYPWVLLGLVLVPLAGWRIWRARRDRAIVYSSAAEGWSASPTWRQRIAWLPDALMLVALTLCVVALARPRYGRQHTVIDTEGIAMQLVVDRSGSMRAHDFHIDTQPVDRLTAIKNVASEFVLGDDPDSADDQPQGRFSDLIGLITFAGYADAISPPTLDHQFLIAHLNRVDIVRDDAEDGTAIGDAISLAVEKLQSLQQPQGEKPQSKVIILLTDGENTAGEIDPMQAAELAQSFGIKIYTIGVGTTGQAPFPVRRSRSGRMLFQSVKVTIDEQTLRAIANQTGGRYFRATDTQTLQQIYDEIDQLEKTKIQSQRLVDYREFAVQPIQVGSVQIPPLLMLALLVLATRTVLRHTALRSVD